MQPFKFSCILRSFFWALPEWLKWVTILFSTEIISVISGWVFSASLIINWSVWIKQHIDCNSASLTVFTMRPLSWTTACILDLSISHKLNNSCRAWGVFCPLCGSLKCLMFSTAYLRLKVASTQWAVKLRKLT